MQRGWPKLPAAHVHTHKRTHTQDLPVAVSDLHIIRASDSPSFSWPLFFTSSLECNGGLIRSIHGRHRATFAGDKAVETLQSVHVKSGNKAATTTTRRMAYLHYLCH